MKLMFKNKLRKATEDRDNLLRVKMKALELALSAWESTKTLLTPKTPDLTLTFLELMKPLDNACLLANVLKLIKDLFLALPCTCVSKLLLLYLTIALGRSGTWTLVRTS